MATGFHGGGGAHREKVDVNLTETLASHSTGEKPEAGAAKPEDLKITITESLCGALASGVMMVGYIFGRKGPEDDITCASELAFELHKRFLATLGSKYCSVLRPFHHKVSADSSCGEIYYTGARLAVELILSAREVCPQCPNIMLPVLEEVGAE